MKNAKQMITSAMIMALAVHPCLSDISINLKASYMVIAEDSAVGGTGPAFWLVWSADNSLGQIKADGSIDDGDIPFFEGVFDYHPLANYYGISLSPAAGRVFVDGDASVPDFNTGFLFGVGFNAPSGAIAAGTTYNITPPADLSSFADPESPSVPPATPDNFDFAENATFVVTAGVYQVGEAFEVDSDGDGLSDDDEIYVYFTNPYDPDSDGDGLWDGGEILEYNTDPNNPDSDGDWLMDGGEIYYGFDPNIADNLYTSNSIMDLAMGYMMIQPTPSNTVYLRLQLKQCTNLVEGVWTNVGDAVWWEAPAAEGKSFFRVRGSP